MIKKGLSFLKPFFMLRNQMKREIIITNDGSTTIRIPEWDENYHSTHGAIQEAKHVFIKNGLDLFQNQDSISILEVGFGTGLNAFITFLETLNKEKVLFLIDKKVSKRSVMKRLKLTQYMVTKILKN